MQRLTLIAFAAATVGVWSQLQAAPAPAPSVAKSRSLTCSSPDWATTVVLDENGDGTATTWIAATVNNLFMGTLHFDSTAYTITANIQPGQSGQGGGSGAGAFTHEVWLLDFNTWEFTGPFQASATLEVANTTTLSANVSQGVNVQVDPLTGQTSIVRRHVVGSQAMGDTSASLSVWLEGNLIQQTSGGWGMVGVNQTHNVVRIR